tara:strand:- start:191 stop:382 length:192 start_codon:yes stop_codon:yes gene_type:complete
MKHGDFVIGQDFLAATGTCRCIDIGTQTVITIKVSDYDDPSWFNGPPYAVVETMFGEDDWEAC